MLTTSRPFRRAAAAARRRRAAVAWAASLAAPAHAQGVVYDNGPPNGVENVEITRHLAADDFTLTGPTTLTAVRFWTAEPRDAYRGSLTWQLFADGGSAPGALLRTGTAAPVRTDLGPAPNPDLARYQNDFALPAVTLPGGSYWLGLHNGPLADTAFVTYLWILTESGASRPHTYDDLTTPAAGRTPGNGHMAFTIYGRAAPTTTVPEPAPWALVAAGLAAVTAAGRARRPA